MKEGAAGSCEHCHHPMGTGEVISLNFNTVSGYSLGCPLSPSAPGELWWSVQDQWDHPELMQGSSRDGLDGL